ncbi:hypothetical protein HDU89_008221 [Geranomyces variabilis]|nr:hypothetical protein HDU89_008221 [Geranomyces variabilis]
MGESRTELLAWLNDLLQVGYTKIEQCGTGAAHCQIIDSIYRDVPLSKVKFNAKHEYEYVANFKILQNSFDKHKIDNAIPVERLLKCKFQDNLEFLQWMKKFWDNYFPGGNYDATARRGGKAGSDTPVRGSTQKLATTTAKRPVPGAGPAKAVRSSVGARTTGEAAARSADPQRNSEIEAEYQKALQDMQNQVLEAKITVEQVEKEREFYFLKLREIEIYVQQQIETGKHPEETVLTNIANIMYKTEEGFEIPQGEGAEEETF